MKRQVTISLNEETLEFVEKFMHKQALKNRSEAIDTLIQRFMPQDFHGKLEVAK